ncbi:MAG: NAD(P)-dependent alcohol dehydrogenase [Flavobacteriaceae bacterium]
MKAIVSKRYGRPSELQLQEIDIPIPGDKEVLVKIKATTINDWDWSLIRGKPYIYRLIYGLLRPKKTVFGVEIAGIVDSLGAGATHFVPGDKVYGDISLVGYGGWAEYVAVPESALLPMPDQIGFETAASLPHACALAYQGLIEYGLLDKGEKVLINGGGGGVGTFGVQIAYNSGAGEVNGVDSGEKFPMMRQLGFDNLVDYMKIDFTKSSQRYDLILDTKTTRSPFAYLKSLHPHGRYVTVGGSPLRILFLLLCKPLVAMFSSKRVNLVALKPNEGMDKLVPWIESGKLKSVIDGPYTLEEIPDCLEYFGLGKHLGKIVICMEPTET